MAPHTPTVRGFYRVVPRGHWRARSWRSYVDMSDDDLLVHVAKHVLSDREAWDEVLGAPVPNLPALDRRDVALLQVSVRLRNALDELETAFGADSQLALNAVLCEDVLALLSVPLVRVGGPAIVLAIDRLTRGWTDEPERARRRAVSVLERAGLLDAEARAAEKPLVMLQRDGLLPALRTLLDSADPEQWLVRAGQLPTFVRDAIRGARTAIRKRAHGGDFLARCFQLREEARQRLTTALGPHLHTLGVAYLEAAHRAAEEAGEMPRHCEYVRSQRTSVEAYVASNGVAVCIGRAAGPRAGRFRLFTAHRPDVGRTSAERLFEAADDELLRAVYKLRAQHPFLSELGREDRIEGLYTLESWSM